MNICFNPPEGISSAYRAVCIGVNITPESPQKLPDARLLYIICGLDANSRQNGGDRPSTLPPKKPFLKAPSPCITPKSPPYPAVRP